MYRHQQPLSLASSRAFLEDLRGNAYSTAVNFATANPTTAQRLGYVQRAQELSPIRFLFERSYARKNKHASSFRESLKLGAKKRFGSLAKAAKYVVEGMLSEKALVESVKASMPASVASILWNLAIAESELNYMALVMRIVRGYGIPIVDMQVRPTSLDEHQKYASPAWCVAVEIKYIDPRRVTLNMLEHETQTLETTTTPAVLQGARDAFSAVLASAEECTDEQREYLTMDPPELLKRLKNGTLYAPPCRHHVWNLFEQAMYNFRDMVNNDSAYRAFRAYASALQDVSKARCKRTKVAVEVQALETRLRTICKMQSDPEKPPLVDPAAFPFLAHVTTVKSIVDVQMTKWHAPPGAFSNFRLSIVEADRIFLQRRRASGTLTEDPFFISLECEGDECVIGGTTIPVPSCTVRISRSCDVDEARVAAESPLVIDFTQDHYDGLYGKSPTDQPSAVTIASDGSAIFTDEGRTLEPLLSLWNKDTELTFESLLGVCKGRCIFCHRALSRNASKEKGYGDVCETHFRNTIDTLRGKVEHRVDHESSIIGGVDVRPAQRQRVMTVRLNSVQVPSVLIEHSPVLKLLLDDCEDGAEVAGKIERLAHVFCVDEDLLNTAAEWLHADGAFTPKRTAEVANLFDVLGMSDPLKRLIRNVKYSLALMI